LAVCKQKKDINRFRSIRDGEGAGRNAGDECHRTHTGSVSVPNELTSRRQRQRTTLYNNKTYHQHMTEHR